jgi:hypothetical protein
LVRGFGCLAVVLVVVTARQLQQGVPVVAAVTCRIQGCPVTTQGMVFPKGRQVEMRSLDMVAVAVVAQRSQERLRQRHYVEMGGMVKRAHFQGPQCIILVVAVQGAHLQ